MKSLFVLIPILNYLFLSDVHSEELKIVSLAPITCQILRDLGLSKNLIGATNTCQDVMNRNVENLGPYGLLSVEKIHNLKPDLILLTEGAQNQKDSFQKLGLKIQEIKTSRLKSFKTSFLQLAKILKKKELGERILNERDNFIDKIKTEQTQNISTLILFTDPSQHLSSMSFYGIGQNTFYDDILITLGYKNVLSTSSYNIISLEGVCSLNPSCLILASNKEDNKTKETLQNCLKNTKTILTDKKNFLLPGLNYPQIAQTISSCQGE